MTRRSILAQGLALALKQGHWDRSTRLIEDQVTSGQVSAATLYIRQQSTVSQFAFGQAKDVNAVFLIASITKPMTSTAVMTLVDRKQLFLSDPVQRHIPEFKGDGRELVLLRHLLTHTSGLPDMLPEDQDLRRRHAPLNDFVERTCRTPLLFKPGSELRYQSMGILLASEIVSRITGQPFPAVIRDHVFQALGMSATSLGLGGRAISETMQCQVRTATAWDWNSSYWRNLAAPWGGAHATCGDVARFLQYFAHPDSRVLKPETARVMVTNQVSGLNQSWGLGWMLNNGQFAAGCSPGTFGHSGSTGTLCWFDPKKDLTFVLLTTKPAEQSQNTLLKPVAELVSEEA